MRDHDDACPDPFVSGAHPDVRTHGTVTRSSPTLGVTELLFGAGPVCKSGDVQSIAGSGFLRKHSR